MYLIYSTTLFILGILLSPIILISFAIMPKLRAGFWQKIGLYPKLIKKKPTIWVHAVSVGEVNAVESLIKRLRQEYQDSNIVLTTVTRTGNQVANSKLSKIVNNMVYFPYDFSFSVESAIKAINPDLVVIAETEIWPNFSKELNRRNIPLVIVNGRISPGSYKGYKKFSLFFRNILSNYSLILMQTEDDKKRIIDIGANPEKVQVMGNLKFDLAGVLTQDEINSLKKSLNLGSFKLIIAGSTHQGEDEIVLNTFKKLKTEFNDIKLLIAPRHPERHSQVLKLISETDFNYGLRSKQDSFEDKEIIMLDTMGELGKLYSISHIAFIGGSFSNTGGHNPLEPAIYGVPVLSGPTVFNFKDIYKFLTATNAAILVENESALYEKLKIMLTDSAKYAETSNACKKIFETNKGALDFAMTRLKEYLGK